MAADQAETRRVVAGSEDGGRLDVFLARALPELSRSRIQHLLREGRITAAGHPLKASTPVVPGMAIDVVVPQPAKGTPEPEPLPIAILYDDDDVVAIDKAAGMVVHPGAGQPRGTLVNALLHHVRGLSGIGGEERPGIVHRLDRGTSGVMIVAKHDRAHRALTRQFQQRTVVKEYVALVWGRPEPGMTMDRPIGRDPRHRLKMSGRAPRGRAASTEIRTVEPLDGVSFVRVAIGTGRTHQIRVHLSEAGYPIVGDALYGGVRRRVVAALAPVQRLTRPFLHSARLTVTHPSTGLPLTIEAPLPPDLADVLDTLRRTAANTRTGTTR